jgi:hypothetical protein
MNAMAVSYGMSSEAGVSNLPLYSENPLPFGRPSPDALDRRSRGCRGAGRLRSVDAIVAPR